jgi:hypothetical protein
LYTSTDSELFFIPSGDRIPSFQLLKTLSHKAIIIIMVLVLSGISIVAPLIVVPQTIWLMPLTTPFQTYNSNFQQQRKSKASLNPLNLKYMWM